MIGDGVVPLTISRPTHGGYNCDDCKHYRWYYDRCEKWGTEIDAREAHNCFEPRTDDTREETSEVNPNMVCDYWKPFRQTNADRIRGMTDEELADMFDKEISGGVICPPKHTHKYCADGDCNKCWLDWLKEEGE